MNASALPQKQPGYCRIRTALPAGDLSADAMKRLAELADRYGRGVVRCTPRHEIEIPFIREGDTHVVAAELTAMGLRVAGVIERPNVVSCPGADECGVAYVRTKPVCHTMEEYLIRAAAEGPLPPGFRVAVSGCPNECSHGHINDVGFVGSVGTLGQRKMHGFELIVGGDIRGDGRLGDRIAFVSSDDVVPTLRDLITIYREAARPGMSFADLYLALGAEDLVSRLEAKLSQRIWFFEI